MNGTVRLSGICSAGLSESDLAKYNGGRFADIVGVVGCVSPANEDGPAAIKIWPLRGKDGQGLGDGKLWFHVQNITALEVIDTDV